MGFVVNLNGQKSHEIVRKGIEILINLTHRGACGCDPETGDGAGVLIQIPHEFFARECAKLGFSVARAGNLRRGHDVPAGGAATAADLRRNRRAHRSGGRSDGSRMARHSGERRMRSAGRRARRSLTLNRYFCAAGELTQDQLERKLYVVRRRAEAEVAASRHSRNASFSTCRRCRRAPSFIRVCCWLRRSPSFTANWRIPETRSALCLVHQRFSTNTFPTWQLAHPYRYICHNGEINTVRGNVNWMNARESVLASDQFGGDIKKIFPVIQPGGQRHGVAR